MHLHVLDTLAGIVDTSPVVTVQTLVVERRSKPFVLLNTQWPYELSGFLAHQPVRMLARRRVGVLL